MVSPIQNEFERKLFELNLSYSVNNDDFYTISSQTGGEKHIKVQLLPSLPVNKQFHGSKNANHIQAIGLFDIKPLIVGQEPDLFILALQNPVKNRTEFLIIPTQEFWRRHRKDPVSVRRKSLEMVIWIMEDECVYETTNISIEAEWYFISKGVRGRMADRTEIDYTKYLNCWRKIIVK